jgi:hypothetical protein
VYDEGPRKILLHALESVVVDDAAAGAAVVVVVVARVARSSSKCASSSIATTNLPASKLGPCARGGRLRRTTTTSQPSTPPPPYEQGKSIDKVHRTTEGDRPKLPPRVWTVVPWGFLSEFIFSPLPLDRNTDFVLRQRFFTAKANETCNSSSTSLLLRQVLRPRFDLESL